MRNAAKTGSGKRVKKPGRLLRVTEKSPKPTPLQDIPEKILPQKLADYFEIMTMAVFQAGMSWALIHKKWPGFRKAFSDFDPRKVARFGAADVARLLEDPGIVRSEKKITGTIENAKIMLQLDRQHGGFANYLHSHKNYKVLSADINRKFKYVGELSVYYFLFRTSEAVPPFEEWITTIEGDHPRMQEMIEKAAGKLQ